MPVDKKNVIFLVPDAVRPDYLGCYGNSSVMTDEIDKLADEGVRFESVVSAAPWTVPSVSSHLTGKYPHRMDLFSPDFTISESPIDSVFQRFDAAGYTTGAFLDSEKLYEQWSAGVNHHGMSLDIQDVLAFISDNSDEPFFLYNLYRGTHLPYVLKYSKESWYRAQEETMDKLRYGGREGVEECKYRYARSIEQFSEWYLRAIIDRLRNEGILEETIIVVMSDHGESWGERREDRSGMDAFDLHGPHLYDEVLKVPLVVYNLDEHREDAVPTTVRSIDVVPTLYDAVGIGYDTDDPAGPDGASLFPLVRGESDAESRFDVTFSSTTAYENPDAVGMSAISKLSVVRDGWKLIWTQDGDETELCDLDADPNEQTDLATERPDIADRLMSSIRSEIQKATVDVDDEGDNTVRDRLKDLGYL
jgi:arylsulfatase A-like enzyme